jgi:hypothetical protein
MSKAGSAPSTCSSSSGRISVNAATIPRPATITPATNAAAVSSLVTGPAPLGHHDVMTGRWNSVAGLIAAATILALVVAGTIAAATPRLVVHPVSVARGGTVTVSGRGCLAGDLVYLIARPFVGHAFVQHSVATRARSNGTFSRHVHIRTTIRPGRYLITARCGGGNLGVSAALRVY